MSEEIFKISVCIEKVDKGTGVSEHVGEPVPIGQFKEQHEAEDFLDVVDAVFAKDVSRDLAGDSQ